MNGHARPRWIQFLVVYAVFGLATVPAQAEFLLTAEVMPTIGLDGFDTYRITATSDLGNIVGFDFSEVGSYGLTGPMHQLNPFGVSTVFDDVSLSNFHLENSQDTRFLFKSDEVVSLFTNESSDALHGIFALAGDRQLTIGNSVPFLQITTSASSNVNLKASFVVRRPNDSLVEIAVDMPLSSIHLGAAPQLGILPVPEPNVPTAPAPPESGNPGPTIPSQPPAVGAESPNQTPSSGVADLPAPPAIDPPPSPGESSIPLVDPPIYSIGEITTGEYLWHGSILYPEIQLFEYYNVDIVELTGGTFPKLDATDGGITDFAQHGRVAFDGSSAQLFTASHSTTETAWAASNIGLARKVMRPSEMSDSAGDLVSAPEPSSALVLLIGVLIAGSAPTYSRRGR